MTDVYLGLGSNLGDRAAHLRAAVCAIAALPDTELLAESPVYQTPPMGPQDQGAYLNMVVHGATVSAPMQLHEQMQTIELELGRARHDKRRRWGPREIDIDVLLFGELVIDGPALTVPHPGLHERWFVLRPLADLAPTLQHPVLHKTVEQLLSEVETIATEGSLR